MLTTIFSAIGMQIVNGVLDKALAAFTAYNNKQISMEELRTRLYTAMLATFKEVEVAHADTLAKTYATFMASLDKSRLLQAVWTAVTISQLLVLLWHQVGIPFMVYAYRDWWGVADFRYPGSGSTVEWAYALLGACIGFGPLVLRTGPGAGGIVDRLKSMIGK